MPEESADECGLALAWLTELLALNIKALHQLQSGAAYLLVLDAFHGGVVAIEKVILDARFQNDFKENYKELKIAFERLKIVKFLDRERLMSTASPHAAILRWLYSRYKDVPTRPGFDPGVQQSIAWKSQHAHMPMPRLKLGRLTHERTVEEAAGSPQTQPFTKKHKFILGNRPEAASREIVETGDTSICASDRAEGSLVFKPSSSRHLPLQTPRLFSARGSHSVRQDKSTVVAVEQLQRKLALNSTRAMTQLQSHPIAVTPRQITPPASPEATRVHERKAGFSHGRIPSNALTTPQAERAHKAGACRSIVPATARAAEADVTECIPWLMALESVTQPGAGRSVTPDPQPNSGALRAVQTARSASAQRTQRSAAPGASAARWSMDFTGPLRAARPVAEAAGRASPDIKALPAAGQLGRTGQRPCKAVIDSASSMSGRGRTMRRSCDPSEVSLTPRKAAYLSSAADKVEAADLAAQSAVVTALKALPELQLMLKDLGSSNRDGYLHRGKLRCRRWMIGTLIPQTRELLQHVRKLSQLAGADDTLAHARARRARRALKELQEAERAFVDVCDQIAKAERFFPVPGASASSGTSMPPRGQAGARQLEISLKGIAQTTAELQKVWRMIAPASSWAEVSRSPTPRLKGADLSPQDYPASSDDEGSSIAGDSDQGLEVAKSLGALAIVPYIAEEGPALDAQLSAALSELEELDDISADELDMTAASRTAIGLRCSSMPAFPERQALVLQSREADPEPPCQDDATNRGHGDSQGMVRAGSVPCWVTFEGSPARIAPRSPLHDSWATPTGLSPFEAQQQRSAGAGTMRRLELEPPVEEAAEEQPQEDADGAHPQQRGEPAGGCSMQPEPIHGDGDLEQPVLPRAALYVPGNPSLLAASAQHQPGSSPQRSRPAKFAGKDATADSAAADDADTYFSASSGEVPASLGDEAAPAATPPGRQLSIKDRIAALESQSSGSQELQPAAHAASLRRSELRQVRRSTSMPCSAGGEALGHAGGLQSLFSYRGKLSASLLPNIDQGKLQQDATRGEVHAPPQLSGGKPLPPDVLPGCPGQPSVSVPLRMGAGALGQGGLPGCPAHISPPLPVGTGRELVRHGGPAALLPPTSRQTLQADAQGQIDLWADKSGPAGALAPAASKFKDGEIGTETFPDCMYVGTFKHGMRNGLGVCHYMNGDYYEGDWQAGLRHGRGMQQCADGSNYVGDYVRGRREGYGVYVFPNGDRYEGECSGDLPDGHGVYRFQVSGAICEGTWRAGAKHGWFVITVGCKQSCGRWDNGELHYMAEISPASSRPPSPQPRPTQVADDEAEPSTPSLATEAAKAAQAAAECAARLTDEHWSTSGPTQRAIQAILLRSQLPEEL